MLPENYLIHHRGVYTSNQISFQILPGKKQYPQQIKELIHAAWKNATSNPGIHIYNGKVAGLHSFAATQDSLHLVVQETDYKSFYGTNVKNAHQIWQHQDRANALAACAVVETTDATIIVGKRNSTMAEGSGLWHIPGGTLEFSKSAGALRSLMQELGLPLCPESALNPILTMMRELKEEFNIEMGEIPFRLCLGLGENLLMKKPEFLCYFRLSLSSTEVRERVKEARDANEHSKISFVPQEEILDYCAAYPFAPIGKAAITRYWEYVQELLGSFTQ